MSQNEVKVTYRVDYRDVDGLDKALKDASKSQAEFKRGSDQVVRSSRQVGDSTKTVADRFADARKEIDSAKSALMEQLKAAEQNTRAQEANVRALQQQAAQNSVVRGTVNEMKQNLRDLQAAQFALRDSTGKMSQADREYAESLKVAIFQQRQLIQVQQDADRTTGKWFQRLKGVIFQFIIWRVAINYTMRAISALSKELRKGFEEVYSNTQAYKDLSDATQRARNAFVLAIGELTGIEDVMSTVAGLLNNFADDLIKTTAWTNTWADSLKDWNDVAGVSSSIIWSMQAAAEELLKTGDPTRAVAAGAQEFQFRETVREPGSFKNLGNEIERLNEKLNESTVEAKKYDSQINSLVTALIRLEDAQKKANAAIAESQARQTFDISRAFELAARDVAEIEAELADARRKINADAEKALRDLRAKANQAKLKAEQDINDQIAKAREQHYLKMKHMAQNFNLSQIQSQRVYESDRRWLVAEGDVLAIERLDERHALEKQAAKEQYDLQRQQQEELFQLQMKYMQQAAQEQAKALAKSLADQIAEIERQRDEKLRAAEEEAALAKEQRLQERDEEIREIAVTEEEKRRELQAAYDEQIADFATMLGKMGADAGMSKDEIVKIARELWGDDGKFIELVEQSYNQTKNYMTLVGQAVKGALGDAGSASSTYASTLNTTLVPAMNSLASSTWAAVSAQLALNAAQASGGGGGYGGYSGGGRGSYLGPQRRAYGGDTVVSRPTTFMAGERNLPERVIVQPLSPVGGNMSMSWSGGAIPVEGRGNLSGVNLQALGDSIASGMMRQLSTTFERRHGIRGR